MFDGMVLTPTGWVRGQVHFTATIHSVEPDDAAPDDRFILPGFIDLHVHGGGGADVMEGDAAITTMCEFHARHGTTALLATTVTAPKWELMQAVDAVGRAASWPKPGAARVLGLHLEGPFISPDALGAQPPFAIGHDHALIEILCATAPLKVATIAPEIPGGEALIRQLLGHGARVQIGHTTCSYDQASAALAAGASGFTHLFNAMSGMHHRAPGAAGCALAHAAYAEMVFDLLHVAPGSIQAALRAIPGMYGVTDAVAAAGMPDGDYRLGRQAIQKVGNAVRLADGTLAGSVLTMDQALRNLLALGLPMADASARLSAIPAEYLGVTDRGRIAPGCRADFAVVDAAGALLAVVIEGAAVNL